MSGNTSHAAGWAYRGVWGILTRWFRIPEHPPSLPVLSTESVEAFKPARGFIHYLLFQLGVGVFVALMAGAIAGIAIIAAWPEGGLIVVPLALLALAALAAVGVLAIYLRYDTTWYVMTDRSLRIRRGIWVIHETTITFENVQNVHVHQGPLQRLFKIANVHVETAGGGGGAAQQGAHGAQGMGAHRGLIEGVADAHRIRDLLLKRLRRSRSAGLGDEDDEEAEAPASAGAAWSAEHLAALREIRDVARRLRRA